MNAQPCNHDSQHPLADKSVSSGAGVAQILLLTPADATALRTLRLAALLESPTSFAGSLNDEAAQPLSDTEQRLMPRDGSAVLGAFVNDALVGSIGIKRERMAKLTHKAGLWGMFVAPEHRGEGIARMLVTEALNVAKSFGGVRQVMLYVNAVNANAIALYESMGFVTYGVEPCGMLVAGLFYDEHLMVRMLTEPKAGEHQDAGDENGTSISGRRTRPGLTLAQTELAQLMSDISEEQYFAGWLSGLEYDLWALLQHDDPDHTGAFRGTHPRDIRRLRELSAVTGGWIVWSDHADRDIEHVPMSQWETLYASQLLRQKSDAAHQS